MRRIVATRTLVVGLALAGASAALGLDGSPPLLAPATSATEPAELSGAFEVTPLLDEGPILAVPGMALPGGVDSTRRSAPSPPVDDPFGGLPPLVGPADADGPTSRSSTGDVSRLAQPSRNSRSITLEAVPVGTLDPLPDPVRGRDSGRATSTRSTSTPPVHRPRLFGLIPLPGPGAPNRATVPPRPSESEAGLDRLDDPVADPAVDSALKRRVEQQVRSYAGDRLRSFDVRVVDGQVTITARALRFWQKRAVRRTLESLPALAGHRATVDLID